MKQENTEIMELVIKKSLYVSNIIPVMATLPLQGVPLCASEVL